VAKYILLLLSKSGASSLTPRVRAVVRALDALAQEGNLTGIPKKSLLDMVRKQLGHTAVSERTLSKAEAHRRNRPPK
jgi:hypothetical protein